MANINTAKLLSDRQSVRPHTHFMRPLTWCVQSFASQFWQMWPWVGAAWGPAAGVQQQRAWGSPGAGDWSPPCCQLEVLFFFFLPPPPPPPSSRSRERQRRSKITKPNACKHCSKLWKAWWKNSDVFVYIQKFHACAQRWRAERRLFSVPSISALLQ